MKTKGFTKRMLTIVMMVLISVMMVFPAHAASKVKLNCTSKKITVGKQVNLKVKGTSKKVKWSSSNKNIATVSKKGVVTGKNVGKATITAKVGSYKLKCKITVQGKTVTKKVVDHGITYSAKLTPNKQLTLTITNNTSNAISLGWAGDFKAYYVTTAGTYTSGLDVLTSLANTNDLNFAKINAYSSKTYTANLSSLKGNLNTLGLTNIYPLSDSGLPLMNGLSTVKYTVAIPMK